MIDLYAKIKSDSQKIHNGELATGGFSTVFTFTSTDTEIDPQEVSGSYSDIGLSLSPETGLPVESSHIGCSISLNDLTIWDKKTSLDRWKVSFVNNAGLTCAGEIRNAFPDFTFNDLAFTLIINQGGRT